jgi:YHS domain-containing protein
LVGGARVRAGSAGPKKEVSELRPVAVCIMLALALGLVVGCQQAQEAETPSMEATEGEAMEATEEVAMTCPVCGAEVTAESEYTAEYEGETYYFCCDDCRNAFMEDPAKYMQ